MIYDVIVVGAGPAGAVLAYLLAKRGMDVLILEKSTLPRYKVCGGGVTSKAIKLLPFDASPALEVTAAGGILSYAGKPITEVNVHPSVASTVMRAQFDHFLVQQAVQQDAHLLTGQSVSQVGVSDGLVRVNTAAGDISARMLAGADGVNSVVARSMGLLPHRKTGVAIEAELAVPASAITAQGPYATFDFGAIPNGYGWVFPKRDHLSVGVYQARPGKAVGIQKILKRYIASQSILQENQMISVKGHQIPLGGRKAPLHKDRVLLVGDAANLADPWIGEGIYYAILSAHIAADVIATAIESSQPDLSEYSTRVNAEIVRQFSYAQLFARLVYQFPWLCSQLLRKSNMMKTAVFGVLRGDFNFQQLLMALLRSFPNIIADSLKRG